MALKKLVFAPGINRDRTDYSSEGGWYDGDKIRFRQGYPEKIGGWTAVNFDAYDGRASSILSYGTTDDNTLIGIGTNEKMYVLEGTNLFNTTPIRATFTSSDTDNCVATTDTSTTVVITIVGHGGSDGDWVTLSGITGTVGGIPDSELNAEHQIGNVTGSTFEITITTAATSTVASGGGTSIVAVFQISIGYSGTTYGYGWGAGLWSRGTWGSSAVSPISQPARLIFQDKFNNNIIYNFNAGEIFYWEYDVAFSNRGVYLRELPNSRAVPLTNTKVMFAPSGHLLSLGCNEYSETYAIGKVINSITHSGTTATITTDTSHGLDVYDWVVFKGQAPQAYQGELQVLTVPSTTTFTVTLPYTPASDATTVGTYQSVDYSSGTYDPLLVRWANVDANIGPQPEEWKPEITNSAGFLRVKTGSTLVTGFRTRQEVLLFTDIGLSTLQFLGTAEVFGLQEVSEAINIIGPNVVAEANNIVFWMGADKFFAYDGRVNTLPCTVLQYVFEDMNKDQGYLFCSGVNSEFNEVIWFYASGASNSNDRYVIYNYEERIWYYGNLTRTSWTDAGTIRFPLATYNGYVYKHEDGRDDGTTPSTDSLPIESYIQSADVGINDGDNFVLTKRVVPDVKFTTSDTSTAGGVPLTPQVQVTVGVRNFPGASTSTSDVAGNTLTRDVVTTATIDQYTNQVFVRARGRQMNFKIASEDLGVQWQLGTTRVDFKPDGRRG